MDALDSHAGSVLQQFLDGSWALLAFFSRKLSEVEKKNSAFQRKLLTSYSSLCYLCFMLAGREYTIFTDHKTLALALFKVSLPCWSPRQQRHLSYIAEFTSSVVHLPWVENIVADALSRPSAMPDSTASSWFLRHCPSLPFISDPALALCDFNQYSVLQQFYPSVSEMVSTSSLSVLSVPLGDSSLLCVVSTGSLCHLVSLQLCHSLFNPLHNSSHQEFIPLGIGLFEVPLA